VTDYERKLHQMHHGFIKMDHVIMCLKFTYLRCYAAMCAWNKHYDIDDVWKRLMQTWFDSDQDIMDAVIDQWCDHLRSRACWRMVVDTGQWTLW